MLIEQGKRLPKFSEYIEMLHPIECYNDYETLNNLGCVTSGNEDHCFLVQTSENGYRMVPGPEFGPRLYRGQAKHYSTCKPSLFRGQYSHEEAIYWTAKRIELLNLLMFHPAVQDILNWDFDGLHFDFNIQAIAQHYQYPTQMIDLTRSRNIAMFFATHEFSEGILNPKAAIGNLAVLYTVDIAQMFRNRKDSNTIMPLGLDPLPRPSTQKAFGLELDFKEDLESMPGVHTETFIVTKELANNCSDAIGGATSLFPPDEFEQQIDLLRDNNKIFYKAIEVAVKSDLMPVGYSIEKVKSILQEANFRITAEPFPIPSEEIINKTAIEWQKRRKTYLSNVKLRGVANSRF